MIVVTMQDPEEEKEVVYLNNAREEQVERKAMFCFVLDGEERSSPEAKRGIASKDRRYLLQALVLFTAQSLLYPREKQIIRLFVHMN